MNTKVIRKITGALLLIGGLLMIIGTIGFFVNGSTTSLDLENALDAMQMAVVARVGAITAFTAALFLVIVIFAKNLYRGSGVTAGVFALIGFVAQIMINPATSPAAAASSLFNPGSAVAASIGFIMLIVAGLGTLITGIINLAAKSNNT